MPTGNVTGRVVFEHMSRKHCGRVCNKTQEQQAVPENTETIFMAVLHILGKVQSLIKNGDHPCLGCQER